MTMEERIAQLEAELAKLKEKPAACASAYRGAARKCEEYFNSVKGEGQDYRGRFRCEEAARAAFKEKNRVNGKAAKAPAQYIQTEEDGAEYFSLFKEFLAVYQAYIGQE